MNVKIEYQSDKARKFRMERGLSQLQNLILDKTHPGQMKDMIALMTMDTGNGKPENEKFK